MGLSPQGRRRGDMVVGMHWSAHQIQCQHAMPPSMQRELSDMTALKECVHEVCTDPLSERLANEPETDLLNFLVINSLFLSRMSSRVHPSLCPGCVYEGIHCQHCLGIATRMPTCESHAIVIATLLHEPPHRWRGIGTKICDNGSISCDVTIVSLRPWKDLVG